MRSKPIVTFLFMLSMTSATAQIEDFPSYHTVLHRFFSSYSADSLKIGAPNTLHFARKPSGWFIQVEDLDSKNILWDRPIWDNSRKAWKSLGAGFARLENLSDSNKYTDQFLWDSVFYDYNLYYGYKGWEKDVIDVLTPLEGNLQDKQSYQFARAYSDLADFVIWPERSFPNEYLKYDSTLDPADIPTALVQTFIRYKDSAILLYHPLLEKKKNFTTPIGDIRTAYSNEFLTAYSLLTMIGQSAAARKYLVDSLYDPFTLDFYKNTLLACDSNTVLFTSGDNDTYVIVYLQEHFGFRKDITSVMRNFISLGRYVHYITRMIPEQQRLHTRLPIDFYKPGINSYHFISKSDTRFTNANEFLSHITANWKTIPKSQDSLVEPGDPLELHFPVKSVVDPRRLFTWVLTRNDYLPKDDIFFTDFLANNAFLRPIQFFSPDFGLQDHSYLYGLINRVFPDSLTTEKMNRINVKNYTNIFNSFTYAPLDSLSKHNETLLNDISWYNYAFTVIAQDLLNTGSTALATKLLDKYIELFPDPLIPFDSKSFYIIQLFYYANESEEADALLQVLAMRLKDDLMENIRAKNHNAQMNDDMTTIKHITELADQLNRPNDVTTNLKAIRDTMENAYHTVN